MWLPWLLIMVSPELERAQKQFYTGDYEKASVALEPLIARDDVDRAEKRDALMLQAAAQFALNQHAEAKRKIAAALALDPTFRPTEFAPKILRFFETTRTELYPLPSVERAQRFVTVEDGERLIVHMHFVVDAAVPRPLELCAPECVPVEHGSARLDLGDVPRAELVWRLRTRDTKELVLGPEHQSIARIVRVQAVSQPATTPVVNEAPPPPPLYTRWWFWLPIGVVVAGGIAAAIAVSAQPKVGPAEITWTLR